LHIDSNHSSSHLSQGSLGVMSLQSSAASSDPSAASSVSSSSLSDHLTSVKQISHPPHSLELNAVHASSLESNREIDEDGSDLEDGVDAAVVPHNPDPVSNSMLEQDFVEVGSSLIKQSNYLI
jgi:hypothetical protein